MALNGISQLATKELKQRAKLDLAAIKRAANGNPRATYDIQQLPTQYAGNAVIDNANTGGLIVGRPWTAISSLQPTIINGGTAATEYDPELNIDGGTASTEYDPESNINGGGA